MQATGKSNVCGYKHEVVNGRLSRSSCGRNALAYFTSMAKNLFASHWLVAKPLAYTPKFAGSNPGQKYWKEVKQSKTLTQVKDLSRIKRNHDWIYFVK